MKHMKGRFLSAVVLSLASLYVPAAALKPPPEFTHTRASDWVNSDPLTLAKLKGNVVVVEFWALECVNCLNSRAWVETIVQNKGPAGLVVVSVHTPELPSERSPDAVRQAVTRLNIKNPVMIDGDSSYWGALHNQTWPTFYIIGRDGLLYGSVRGEMHSGEERAQKVEGVLDQLLAAGPH
jgi:thiol-disulfide isomerase/thioredoxin